MGLVFYNIFLILYKAGIYIASLFDVKAKKWLHGRKEIWDKLKKGVESLHVSPAGDKLQIVEHESHGSKLVWMHCASLGEFEQGRPVIERLRTQYPNCKLLLTFFSPSGYEVRKDYEGVDQVSYLPMDGSQNAHRFLEIVKPSLVIFVKYEYWYYYLKEINQKKIPLLLVSALFRENAVFFKWYGRLQRKMLSFFTHIFVQNPESSILLNQIDLANKCIVAGDTRFDRVIEIAENASPLPGIEEFIANGKTIIAGSTWPEDEEVLQKAILAINDPSLKLIVAPHEITNHHISKLITQFPGAVLYSDFKTSGFWSQKSSILIIDNIGMLSRLYKYAYITYVGGGFGKGIHNTLEAAVFGKPVLFGPSYGKFNEAIELVANGGAVSISNSRECITVIQKFLQDEAEYISSCQNSKEYVYANRGATQKIMQYIQENRLLTN